jgi:alpha-glucuronidase
MNVQIKKSFLLLLPFLFLSINLFAQADYKLWLQYRKVQDSKLALEYKSNINGIVAFGNFETIQVASKELQLGLSGLLDTKIEVQQNIDIENALIFGSKASLNEEILKNLKNEFEQINDEGFIIKTISLNNKNHILITGKTDVGVLYGIFRFLRLLQTNTSIENLNIVDSPKINVRILNHWDNLNRTVERGYAGASLWNWQKLPDFIDQRYIDYARANASIGINGTVLSNVNANALILTPQYLEKVEALANAFRPYGIKVYLTARFSAPIEIGGLKTADPFDAKVQIWWKDKAAEIYKRIPDFGKSQFRRTTWTSKLRQKPR